MGTYACNKIYCVKFFGILDSISFVNKIIFGRLNYNVNVKKYVDYQNFFNSQSLKVIEFCKKNKKAYHIKKGTIDKTLHFDNRKNKEIINFTMN
jgi:hypothetical protein